MRILQVFLVVLCLTQPYLNAFAQSPGYTIESFQGEYTELTEYGSVVWDTENDLLWRHDFPLDFQFPYYDSTYNKVMFAHNNWGYFTDDEEFSLFLFEFTDFTTESYSDTIGGFPSDVRYAHVLSNNLKAFVLQYTNNILFCDVFNDDIDNYLNWQVWLFENGVMEIHFGDIDMDGNPVYEPGIGFYNSITCDEIDSSEIYAPHVSIANPKDQSDAIAVSGRYDNFEITGQQNSIFNTMPPEGWIIRFKPKSVGLFEPDYRITEFSINPNPAVSYIVIPEPGSHVTIYDFSGKVMYEGIATDNKLSVAAFPPGIYIVRISSGSSSSIGKFYKS